MYDVFSFPAEAYNSQMGGDGPLPSHRPSWNHTTKELPQDRDATFSLLHFSNTQISCYEKRRSSSQLRWVAKGRFTIDECVVNREARQWMFFSSKWFRIREGFKLSLSHLVLHSNEETHGRFQWRGRQSYQNCDSIDVHTRGRRGPEIAALTANKTTYHS